MDITFATYSDIGDREKNEDSLLAEKIKEQYCFVVADGLGGYLGGEIASGLVCQTTHNFMLRHSPINNSMIPQVFNACQSALLQQQKDANADGQIRTTMNLLCLDHREAYWGHIGDSRTYYFHNKHLIRRTFDHSVPQMLVAMGELEESHIRFHEDRNRLLKVLGASGSPPQLQQEQPVLLTGNQHFLLCSDGFWEYISEEQILLCLDEADSPDSWLDNMLELIRRNSRTKHKDNLTAVAVWIAQ